MGMRIPKDLEREILARADKVGPSMVEPVDGERSKPPVKAFVLPAESEWTFRIPDWAPTPLNKILYGRHWTAGAKVKKSDGEIVAHYGRGIPKAVGKRVVSLHVVFPPGKRMPDVDALWKSTLDSLVACGILVNDSAAWASMDPVQYSRGQALTTFITLQDLT